MSSLFFFTLFFAHFFPCFVALWFSSFFHLSLSLSCAHHHHHRLFFFSISLPFQTLSLSLSFSLGNQSPLAFHSSPRLYVQVLQRRSLQAVRPFLDPARDVLVSVEQTRHRLLALSALCPGASTLLSNLLRRAAVPPPPPLPGQLQQQKGGGGGGGGQGGGGQRRLKGNSGGGSSLDAAAAAASQQQQRRTAGGRRWLRSYMNGCGNKIHVVRLTSPSLANVPFADAAAAMHAATGVLMIGVMRGGRSSSSSSSPSSSSSSFSSSSSSPAAVAGTVLNPGRRLLRGGITRLAGMDEVGRGAPAGPATVGVVVVDDGSPPAPLGVRDSKLLRPSARESLVPVIEVWAVAWAVGHAEPWEVDQFGVTGALRLAGLRALSQLAVPPDLVLLDGAHDWLSPSVLSVPNH